MLDPFNVQVAGATLEIVDLGRLGYAAALEEQRRRQRDVIEGRQSKSPRMDLLLVEHDPVITISRRPGAKAHLLATPDQLQARGVGIHETDRGGDITLHAPGQLVVYPILDLNRMGLRLHSYLRWMEDLVIGLLGEFGIAGTRDACATGVWIGEPPRSRKICAMGVRVSRWVSMHGLALNVQPDLSLFDLIVPCGLRNRGVTSLAVEGASVTEMETIKRMMAQAFIAALRERTA